MVLEVTSIYMVVNVLPWITVQPNLTPCSTLMGNFKQFCPILSRPVLSRPWLCCEWTLRCRLFIPAPSALLAAVNEHWKHRCQQTESRLLQHNNGCRCVYSQLPFMVCADMNKAPHTENAHSQLSVCVCVFVSKCFCALESLWWRGAFVIFAKM